MLGLLAATPAAALEIARAEDCAAAVAADPLAAREAAARWHRLGGGTPARLCEAAALEALGAEATAAELLTRLAENPNRALPAGVRAAILSDAARLWLEAARPDLARAALDRAGRLAEPDRAALLLAARAAAAGGEWSEARAALDRVLAAAPEDAEARALRAATLRHEGDPEAALADARRALAAEPGAPEASFEEAAALAELGRTDEAIGAFLDLAATYPDHPLSELARTNVRRLAP